MTDPVPAGGQSPYPVVRWILAAALLGSVGYAVALSARIQASFGPPDDPLYQTSMHQLEATTFLRVAFAAIAFWLTLLHRRTGYWMALLLGLVTVVLFAIAITGPVEAGPPLAPPWLQALGLADAAVLIVGGALALGLRARRPRA